MVLFQSNSKAYLPASLITTPSDAPKKNTKTKPPPIKQVALVPQPTPPSPPQHGHIPSQNRPKLRRNRRERLKCNLGNAPSSAHPDPISVSRFRLFCLFRWRGAQKGSRKNAHIYRSNIYAQTCAGVAPPDNRAKLHWKIDLNLFCAPTVQLMRTR